MDVKEETVEGRTVLHVRGRADNASAAIFQELVDPYLDDNRTDLILDLSGLDYISSAGLRVLLVIARKLEANNGKGVLCGMSDVVSDILEISGFIKLYGVAKNVDSAVKPG